MTSASGGTNMACQGSETSQSLVEDLLSEGVDAARAREFGTFDDLVRPLGNSIVLFGAGGLGRRCLSGLRQHGIEPIAFADNNPNMWKRQVEGVPVFSAEEAAQRFGETAVFVVSIWGAHSKDRMRDRENQLRSLSCRKVVPFGPLFWKYPEPVLPHYAADLPHHVIEKADEVLACYDLWADSESKREYIAQLKWRLTFDFESMSPPVREAIYFPPDLVELGSDEVFVDCGAFDGDTLELFLRKSKSSFARVFAFEPDPANFNRLSQSLSAFPDRVRDRIEIKCAAVGAKAQTVRLSAEGAASSAVGSGDLEVECVTLDESLADCAPTMIKMDIEGSEPDAIRGAARLIRETAPLLAISGYHKQDHLWSIPLLIKSLNSEYRFYLRPHDLEGWDLVCYGIPRARKR